MPRMNEVQHRPRGSIYLKSLSADIRRTTPDSRDADISLIPTARSFPTSWQKIFNGKTEFDGLFGMSNLDIIGALHQ